VQTIALRAKKSASVSFYEPAIKSCIYIYTCEESNINLQQLEHIISWPVFPLISFAAAGFEPRSVGRFSFDFGRAGVYIPPLQPAGMLHSCCTSADWGHEMKKSLKSNWRINGAPLACRFFPSSAANFARSQRRSRLRRQVVLWVFRDVNFLFLHAGRPAGPPIVWINFSRCVAAGKSC
jgi:hypothetical protein